MVRLLTLIATCGFLSFIAAAAGEKKFSFVDLQPYASQKVTDKFGRGIEGNSFVGLPKDMQTFEGIKFKIGDGFILLGSELLTERKPTKVEAIKIGKAFSRLHFLHATGFGNGSVIGGQGKDGDPLFVPDDTRIGEYRIHYEDGGMEIIPVVYGKDVRDWWFTEKSKGVTRGKTAWKGDNEAAKEFGSQIRLFLTSWENPRPTKRVTSFDFVKIGDSPAAPFCVAATTEE